MRYQPHPALQVFGIGCFLAIGIWCMWRGGSWWIDYHRSADWTSVPAFIQNVDLQMVRSRRPNNPPWRLRCSYRYEVDGHAYRGERVTVTDQAESHELQSSRMQTLELHRASSLPYSALVNPSDPAEAMLFRSWESRIMWLPIVGLIFFSTPLLFLLALRVARRERRIEREVERMT